MNTGMKRAAMLALSASLAMTSLAGCSKKEQNFDAAAAALTVNGEEISAGLLSFSVHYTQALTQYVYDSYFGDNSFNYDMGSGSTIGDYVLQSAVALTENQVLARQHMDEYDVSLTEEEETAIAETAAAFLAANDEETLTAISATQEIVEEYLTLYTIQSKMETLMAADVDTEVSDEEAAQRRIQYVYIAMETEGETEEETEEESALEEESEAVGETEAETADLEAADTTKTQSSGETETEADTAEAETDTEPAAETEEETETETEDPETAAAMAKAYEKAQQIIDLMQEEELDMDAAAAEVDEELSSSEMTFGSDSTSVVDALITATEGVGDDTLITEPVEGTNGYYVVRVVSEIDEEATTEKKEEIIKERQNEAVTNLYTEWADESEITTDEKVLATIVFDFNLTQYAEEETEAESAAEEESETESAAEPDTEAESDAESETVASEEAETEEETETEEE